MAFICTVDHWEMEEDNNKFQKTENHGSGPAEFNIVNNVLDVLPGRGIQVCEVFCLYCRESR